MRHYYNIGSSVEAMQKVVDDAARLREQAHRDREAADMTYKAIGLAIGLAGILHLATKGRR